MDCLMTWRICHLVSDSERLSFVVIQRVQRAIAILLRFPFPLTTLTSLTTLKTKSFPFSALILLRRLFLLLARHSAQAPSALASCVGSVFPLQAKTEKLKVFRFPLSVFRFVYYLCADIYLRTQTKHKITL